jgi:hypothetical protein
MRPIALEPVVMKDVGDCAIACLRMLTGLPYEAVFQALPKRLQGSALHAGLSNASILAVARKLKFPLVYRSITNPDDLPETIGILDLHRHKEGHVVVWLKNVLYNPADAFIWTDVETFLATRGWTLAGIFLSQEDP